MNFIEHMKRQLARLEERTAANRERIRILERNRAERRIAALNLRKRRKPPEAGLAVPAVPPKDPSPKSGGAAAPLDFD